MPLFVATNYDSLAAQNNITTNRSQLDTSLTRLSSGLRINSAADDAAGLAISTRLQNQISGLTQGGQNANSGISLANVADSALAQVVSNLQRIRTLAVQAENSTNSTTDRQALDAEVQQRLAEIQRIATQTNYNGTNLLDGSFSGAQFQVGANVGQTISLSTAAQNAQTTSLGSFVNLAGNTAYAAAGNQVAGTVTAVTVTASAVGANGTASGTSYQGVNATAITNGALQINGTNVLASSGFTGNTYQDSTSAFAKAAAINASGISGLQAVATNTQTFDSTATNTGSGNFVNLSVPAASTATYSLSINGTSIISQSLTATAQTISNATLAAAVNSQSSTTGVAATVNSNGTIAFSAADGRNIAFQETVVGAANAQTVVTALGTYVTTNAVNTATETTTVRGQVQLESTNALTFNTPAQNGLIGEATTLATQAATSSLSAQNVQSITNASSTIYSVDSAISTVNAYRATYGAVVNRLTSAVNAIGAQVQQLTTANGRITSADFASETTNLSTAQIIQQAGTSILAQANSLPQGILKLLQ